MDLAEEEEAAMAAGIMVVAMAVAMAAGIMAVAMVVAMAAGIMAVDMVVAMAAGILNLIALTQINLLVQMVGKIEVMEILLKTLNMKVVEAEEKGEFQMRTILQAR